MAAIEDDIIVGKRMKLHLHCCSKSHERTGETYLWLLNFLLKIKFSVKKSRECFYCLWRVVTHCLHNKNQTPSEFGDIVEFNSTTRGGYYKLRGFDGWKKNSDIKERCLCDPLAWSMLQKMCN